MGRDQAGRHQEQPIDRLEKLEALAFWVEHCPTVEFGESGSQVRDKTRDLGCEVAVSHSLPKFRIRELVYQLRQGFDEGLIRRQSFFVTVAHQSCGSCRKTTPGKLADDTGLADPSLSRHQHYVPASRPDTLPHSIHRCQFFLAPEKFARACDC